MLLLVYSLLGIAAAVFITLFMITISCDSQSSITLQCVAIGGGIGLGTLFSNTILPLIVRAGLPRESSPSFWLTIIFSLMIILYLPVGTALAVYLIWIKKNQVKNI